MHINHWQITQSISTKKMLKYDYWELSKLFQYSSWIPPIRTDFACLLANSEINLDLNMNAYLAYVVNRTHYTTNFLPVKELNCK